MAFQENRYNLNAGCLPCPACYNLVQKRVNELRKKLSDVFGGNGGGDEGDDAVKLSDQISQLNSTVQKMYQLALENSGGKIS